MKPIIFSMVILASVLSVVMGRAQQTIDVDQDSDSDVESDSESSPVEYGPPELSIHLSEDHNESYVPPVPTQGFGGRAPSSPLWNYTVCWEEDVLSCQSICPEGFCAKAGPQSLDCYCHQEPAPSSLFSCEKAGTVLPGDVAVSPETDGDVCRNEVVAEKFETPVDYYVCMDPEDYFYCAFVDRPSK